MKSIPINLVESKFRPLDSQMNTFIKSTENKLIKLRDNKLSKCTPSEKRYLNQLIGNVDKFVYASPSSLKKLQKKIGIVPLTRKSKKQKSFKDKILTAFNYETLRSDFFPDYFHSLDIKACVYCNAQLTVCVENTSKKTTDAKFQLDHYIPKSQYPFLSISFFNLYPVCASCNLAKGKKNVSFDLYGNKTYGFNFTLKKGVAAKFLRSKNINDIEFTFKEPKAGKNAESFEKLFKISGVYQTQKDIIEELILKSRIYTKTYKRALITSFKSLFTNGSLNNRLIIGNYSSEDEIHKRPMAKFTQDIARQLKLIK